MKTEIIEEKQAEIEQLGERLVRTPKGMGFPAGFQVTQKGERVTVRLLVWHGSTNPDGIPIVDAYPVVMVQALK